MSFIRPEILAAARRHRSMLTASSIGLAGAWLAWRGLSGGGPLLTLLGLAVAGLTVTFLVADRQRARFRRATSQPGIVQIDEAQISYFGPDTGGIVDRDALLRVDLVSSGDGLAHWRLTHEGGPPVNVPLSAEGADRLVDLLMTLPGVEIGAALAALDRRRRAVVPVWSITNR